MESLRTCLRLSCPTEFEIHLGTIMDVWFANRRRPRRLTGPDWSVWLVQVGDREKQSLGSAIQELRAGLGGLLDAAMAHHAVQADLMVILHAETVGRAHCSAEDIAFLATHRIALYVDFYDGR